MFIRNFFLKDISFRLGLHKKLFQSCMDTLAVVFVLVFVKNMDPERSIKDKMGIAR